MEAEAEAEPAAFDEAPAGAEKPGAADAAAAAEAEAAPADEPKGRKPLAAKPRNFQFFKRKKSGKTTPPKPAVEVQTSSA